MKIMSFIKSVLFSDRLNKKVDKLIGVFYLLKNKNLTDNQRFKLNIREVQYYSEDRGTTTAFDSHYLYHCSWAARIIAQNKPIQHTDIASSLWFSSIVSAFVPVRLYEYQPSRLELSGLESNHADILNLPFKDQSLSSLSCLHVIEHIGLGRYGDKIDPQGDIKAAMELERVLAVQGTLLICVPVGVPRLCFNAHRIYSFEMVLNLFPELYLKSFALIDDVGTYHCTASPEMVSSQKYACGCFEFVRLQNKI